MSTHGNESTNDFDERFLVELVGKRGLESSVTVGIGQSWPPAGRVIVEPDLSVKGHPNVFVLGDQANFGHGLERPLPGLAPVAIQMGRHCANNIVRDVKGKERKPFHYFDKGIMATIGRADAIVQTGFLKFGGLFAWLTWLFVHIMYLVGFRNRMLVVIQWFWSYVTLRRGARLVTSRNWKLAKRVDLANRYSMSLLLTGTGRRKAGSKAASKKASKKDSKKSSGKKAKPAARKKKPSRG